MIKFHEVIGRKPASCMSFVMQFCIFNFFFCYIRRMRLDREGKILIYKKQNLIQNNGWLWCVTLLKMTRTSQKMFWEGPLGSQNKAKPDSKAKGLLLIVGYMNEWRRQKLRSSVTVTSVPLHVQPSL